MPVDLYGGPTYKPCHLLFSGPTHRLCQVLFSWPMWAFTKAKVKLHMGFHIYTVYMLPNYVVGEGGRTTSCSASREVPTHIEDLLEELMNDVKVMTGCRCYDFAKVFDKDVKKGTDKHKGIKYWLTV